MQTEVEGPLKRELPLLLALAQQLSTRRRPEKLEILSIAKTHAVSFRPGEFPLHQREGFYRDRLKSLAVSTLVQTDLMECGPGGRSPEGAAMELQGQVLLNYGGLPQILPSEAR